MQTIFFTLLFSFFCSAGFGVSFRISPKELPIAGAAGVLTRGALMLAQSATDNRIAYTLAAAAVGAYAARLISMVCFSTTTKFLYPAFVPIIPGDLLYNTVVSFVTASYGDLAANSSQLAQALLGLALGASIVPLFFRSKDYWRQLRGGEGRKFPCSLFRKKV